MSFSLANMSKLTAAVALAAVTSVATAGVPALEFDLTVNGQNFLFNPDGAAVGGGVYNYAGQQQDLDWALSWDINADPDPFISGNLVFQNNSLVAQTFSLTITLPISGPITPSTFIGGSVAGGLTGDGDGGSLTDAGGPVWSALIDGNVVATLLNDPFSVTTGNFGSAAIGPESFGNPIPSQPGPAANGTIGINITFTLGAGDQASFTSVFVVVPAPAGLAMLAVGGIFCGRRRRA